MNDLIMALEEFPDTLAGEKADRVASMFLSYFRPDISFELVSQVAALLNTIEDQEEIEVGVREMVAYVQRRPVNFNEITEALRGAPMYVRKDEVDFI